MYDWLIAPDERLGVVMPNGPDPARFHQGGHERLLKLHRKHVRLWRAGSQFDPAPHLMKRLADARTMRVGLDRVRRAGGDAPGPNGHRCDELDEPAAWSLCRALARSVRHGTYRPGSARRVRIPKGGDRGERILQIPDLEDRIVGRALVEIIEPIFEPDFQPFSYGWRPKRDRRHALAAALTYAEAQDAWHWIVADVADAFDKIPRPRMLAACRQRLPEDVIAFIALLTRGPSKRGLPQGRPDSPLLANIHFDRHLDHAWYRRIPGVPLIRTADDLLVPCGDRETGQDRLRTLGQIAQSAAGTPLKGGTAAGVHDLRHGGVVNWLGFRITMTDNGVAIGVGERAWDHLAESLQRLQGQPLAPLKATQAVFGWLEQAGPTYDAEPHNDFCERLRACAAEYGFDELPADATLLNRWQLAHNRWRQLRDAEAAKLGDRLATIGGHAS